MAVSIILMHESATPYVLFATNLVLVISILQSWTFRIVYTTLNVTLLITAFVKF
jgi:hypothetical protein